jgi:hypothetical protein
MAVSLAKMSASIAALVAEISVANAHRVSQANGSLPPFPNRGRAHRAHKAGTMAAIKNGNLTISYLLIPCSSIDHYSPIRMHLKIIDNV